MLLRALDDGDFWVTRKHGLLFVSKYEDLPDPKTDVELEPFWTTLKKGPFQPSIFHTPMAASAGSLKGKMSIYAHNLLKSAYPKRWGWYRTAVRDMLDNGFIQMRSRRGKTGQFHEVWYLPTVDEAQGHLKRLLDKEKSEYEADKVRVVTNYLHGNFTFESIEVSMHREIPPLL